MRLAPLEAMVGTPLDFSASQDWYLASSNYSPSNLQFGTKIMAAPTELDFTANVANWGQCELMRVVNRGAAIVPGTLVSVDKDLGIAALAVTANTGRPFGVALTNFSSGAVTPQAGWILVAGIAPVTFSVAATVGAVYGGTAGNATPTAAAGRQLLGCSTLIAANATFTRAGQTKNGQRRVTVGRQVGLFVGQAVSGTGIPGGATIAALDPNGVDLFLSANATATGNPTLTFTNTGYGIVQFDRPHVQGQIT